MKTLVILCVAFLAVNARLVRRSANTEFKMCVPEDLLEQCHEMAKQKTQTDSKIICMPARDRVQCIEKIQAHIADFGTVDPEDMYIAGNSSDKDFTVFEEIRTLEEPEAEFRYEGVALVHKDLEISSVEGLKGLRSCHTGVGRNVGYKIPLTKLKNMGIIGKLNEPTMSPRENELDAFSKLFSKACIVGKWSLDPTIDAKLKKRFSNLCQLCEHPEKCDYPDNFSGYDGAIRCLVQNGGQIAWTKVIYIRKFFGLPVGTTPAKPTGNNPNDYAYFCPDGTKVPVTGTPCRWAARPWQGYMANAALVKNIDELRKKIENLNEEGVKTHATWLEKVLEISEKNVAKKNTPINPMEYLRKGNYSDVIEREYGPPYKTVKICVDNENSLRKCEDLIKAAFTRNIRPRFECVASKDCMKTLEENKADIITIGPEELNHAEKHKLQPIMLEQYAEDDFAVAIVKKDSNIKSFADLKGKKSCHTGNALAGFYAPIYTLKKLNLLSKPGKCSADQALADFFSEGCLAKSYGKLGVSDGGKAKLCKLCTNVDKCSMDQNTCTYAMKCLKESGDVAFIRSIALLKLSDEEKQKYELLCPEGGRAPLTDVKKCHMFSSSMPPKMVVTNKSKTEADLDEIKSALLAAAANFSKRPDWFKMFGAYNGKNNLLFSDATKGLLTVPSDFNENNINKIVSVVQNYCK